MVFSIMPCFYTQYVTVFFFDKVVCKCFIYAPVMSDRKMISVYRMGSGNLFARINIVIFIRLIIEAEWLKYASVI